MLFNLKTLMPLEVVFFRGLEVGEVSNLRIDDYVLLTDDSDENLTCREAMKSSLRSEWIEATRKEYNALIENKTGCFLRFPRAEKQLETGGFSK